MCALNSKKNKKIKFVDRLKAGPSPGVSNWSRADLDLIWVQSGPFPVWSTQLLLPGTVEFLLAESAELPVGFWTSPGRQWEQAFPFLTHEHRRHFAVSCRWCGW